MLPQKGRAPGPFKAREACWSRIGAPFSSLPPTTTTTTTTSSSSSSSPPSSSASLQPLLLLDVADELWFYRSVLPFPLPLPPWARSRPRSPSPLLPCFPCFPSLFSSSSPPPDDDSSTLIAQCMFSRLSPPSHHFPAGPFFSSSCSSSSPRPPPESHPSLMTQFAEPRFSPRGLPAYHAYPATHIDDHGDDNKNAYLAFNGEDGKNSYWAYNENSYSENAYRWYASSTSDSEDDADDYRNYPRPGVGEDEDAYHYYTAPSDWDDEDAHHGYAAPSDCEDEQEMDVTKKDAEQEMVLPAYPPKGRAHLKPDDALSGIYDLNSLLKDQHDKGTQEASDKSLTVPSSQFQGDVVSRVSEFPLSHNEQADMKENIKLWAHAVALTLPWKAAAQARPLL